MGRKDDAIEEYTTAVKESSDYLAPRFNAARLLSQKGDINAALTLYHEALLIDPAHTATLKNIAVLYLYRGEPEKARRYLENAIENSPDDTVAKMLLKKITAATNKITDKTY
jgi:tetratricopeptide (TPR) repeat protein